MSRSKRLPLKVIMPLVMFLVAVVAFSMIQKDVYAASSPSCDEGIPTQDYVVSMGKWRLLPPLTRSKLLASSASYDVNVEIFGLKQDCYYDMFYNGILTEGPVIQESETTPLVVKVTNDVTGSQLDDPVSYTFAYRHQYLDGYEYKWTSYTYVQYQGDFNLCKFTPVIPSFLLDDYSIYLQSELYVGCKDTNNHIVRKYLDFVCLAKNAEADYTTAILGVGDDIDSLNSNLQTSEVSVVINEPSYIVDLRDDLFGDGTTPEYSLPDPCPDVFLLQNVYSSFIPNEIIVFGGTGLLLLLCGWWLRN